MRLAQAGRDKFHADATIRFS